MNFAGCIPRFLKAHGSLILTILGGFGLVATVVETAKVAPEAKATLEKTAEEKEEIEIDRIHEQHPEFNLSECYAEADKTNALGLTFWEKVDAAGPHYIPVILLGLGTVACMAGAHILSVKQQASLLAAYGLLQKQFSAYRGEIREKYGEEADHEAYILSQKRIECLQNEVEQLKKLKGYATFGIATAPGLIFRATMLQVEQAFAHFNRNLMMRGCADIKELHTFLGLPESTVLPTAPDEEYGWNEYVNQCNYDIGMVDFFMKDVVANDGEVIHVIYLGIPPYRMLSDNEYDYEEYSSYDVERACEMAKYGFADAAMQVDVDPEHCCYIP